MTAAAGLAALAALAMGLASACQHHAVRQVGRRAFLHPGLVLALVRRPWWLAGVAASAVGLCLQVAALTAGSIVVVQTVLVSCLAWTLAGESLLGRVLPGRRTVGGVALAGAGLVGVLLALRPAVPAQPVTPPVGAVALVAGACAALAAFGLLGAARGTGRTRVLALAATAGVGYGLTAALLKIVGAELRVGWTEPLGHAPLYAAAGVGAAAVLLSQNALQSGRWAAPAVAVMMTVDPVVGIATGVLWFGEQLTTTPAALLAALACTVTTAAGLTLAHPADHAVPGAVSGSARRAPGPPRRASTAPPAG